MRSIGVEVNAIMETQKSSVLLIDHYRVGQRIALLQLSHLGFCGKVVTSCQQAIRAVRKAQYEMILIGWGNPDCDGKFFTKYVRRLDKQHGRHTPIIGVTVHARPGDREKCIALGMDDLLSKPISVQDISNMLCKHIKKVA